MSNHQTEQFNEHILPDETCPAVHPFEPHYKVENTHPKEEVCKECGGVKYTGNYPKKLK